MTGSFVSKKLCLSCCLIFTSLTGHSHASEAHQHQLGLYTCASDSDEPFTLQSMELRPSGYVFITTEQSGDESAKNVATYEFDQNYLIIESSGSYMLFRLENGQLYGESTGLHGYCQLSEEAESGDASTPVQLGALKDATARTSASRTTSSAGEAGIARADSSVITEMTNNLTGEWEDVFGEPGEYYLRFKDDGVFHVVIDGVIEDRGVWNVTSGVDIDITIEGENKATYNYAFSSENYLELKSDNEVGKFQRR